MGTTQMQALAGGKRFKYPYVQEINSRKNYLPQLNAQKKEDAYRNQAFGLESRGLAQNKELTQQGLDLQKDAYDEQKKAQKRANLLGYANMGLGAGLGVAGFGNDMGWWGKGSEVSKDAIDISGITELGTPSSFINQEAPTSSGPMDYLSDIGSSIWNPLKNIGGAIGDFGSGIYDSIVGDAIDFGDFDVFDIAGEL